MERSNNDVNFASKINSNIASFAHSRHNSQINANIHAVDICYDNFESELPKLVRSEKNSVADYEETFEKQYRRKRNQAYAEKPWYVDLFNFLFLCEMCEDSANNKQLSSLNYNQSDGETNRSVKMSRDKKHAK